MFVIQCQILFIHIYKIYKIWFSWVLWHKNHNRLFNAKSYLYIYIKYTGFDLVGFYVIRTIMGYLMPNPIYTNILNMYDLFVVLPWYNYTYSYICGNIINSNDERTHFFRKMYHSRFIRKGCERVVWEVSWRQNRLQHIDPKFFRL